MKESTKWGLILQIPNAIILIVALFYLIINNISMPNFNLNMVAWIIFGTLYGLMNIASIVLLVSGIK